jgi:hypothetical protein
VKSINFGQRRGDDQLPFVSEHNSSGHLRPIVCTLLKDIYDLPALPLCGGQALRHPADLPDSSGSDSPGRAPDSEVFSVGAQAGGRYGVVSRGGVMLEGGGAVQQVHQIAADAHTPPLRFFIFSSDLLFIPCR